MWLAAICGIADRALCPSLLSPAASWARWAGPIMHQNGWRWMDPSVQSETIPAWNLETFSLMRIKPLKHSLLILTVTWTVTHSYTSYDPILWRRGPQFYWAVHHWHLVEEQSTAAANRIINMQFIFSINSNQFKQQLYLLISFFVINILKSFFYDSIGMSKCIYDTF